MAAWAPTEATFAKVRNLFDGAEEFTLKQIRASIGDENPVALAAATGRLAGDGFLRKIEGQSGRGVEYIPDRYVRA